MFMKLFSICVVNGNVPMFGWSEIWQLAPSFKQLRTTVFCLDVQFKLRSLNTKWKWLVDIHIVSCFWVARCNSKGLVWDLHFVMHLKSITIFFIANYT